MTCPPPPAGDPPAPPTLSAADCMQRVADCWRDAGQLLPARASRQTAEATAAFWQAVLRLAPPGAAAEPAAGPGSWELPDALWAVMAPFIPPGPSHAQGGRPRADDRTIATALFYVLRTGIQWKALPRSFGVAPTTVHHRFQEWSAAGVFVRLHAASLHAYDGTCGIQWRWQSTDGAMTKAPLGCQATGRNPTDRGKSGTKRSLLTDGRGEPLAVQVAGANINDHLLLPQTLDAVPIPRPVPTVDEPQNLCLDKGYDYPRTRDTLQERDYTPHLRTRGEEKQAKREIPDYHPRRWVVERTHSWLNRFRRILVRWEKKVDNFIALLQFAFAWHLCRTAAKSVPT